MDWSLIIIDVVSFLAFLGLFLAFKSFRTKHVSLDNQFVKRAVFNESESICKLINQVWNARIQDVMRMCGKQAAIYMSLHKKIGFAMLVMTLVGFPVMLPIYMDGHTQMIYWSVSSIISSESSMIVFVVYLVLFSLMFYYLAYSTSVSSFNTVKTASNKLQIFSLEIQGINKSLSSDQAKKTLENTFSTEFPGRISSIYVVPDYTNSYNSLIEIKRNKLKLQNYQYIKATGKKPIMYANFCRKVNAIQYYWKQLEKLNKKYETGLEYGKQKNTGLAYVVCNSVEDAQFILKNIRRSPDKFYKSIKKAPALEEIKWENIEKLSLWYKFAKACIFIMFLLFYSLLLTGVYFGTYMVQGLQKIGTNIQNAPMINGMTILVYQNFVLRFSIRFLVYIQRNTNLTNDFISSMFKFSIFMTFLIFIYPVITLQIISVVSLSIEGDTQKWRQIFAKAILQSGVFFTSVILQQTFIVNGVDLFQVPVVLKTMMKIWKARSPIQKELAYSADQFDYAYELSRTLTNLMIILCFSLAYPLILPIGCLYFFLRYWVTKYLILCTFHCNNYVTISKIPSVCVRSILTSVFIFQLISSYILILSLQISLLTIGSVFTVLVLIFYITLQFRVSSILNRKQTSPQEPLLRPTSTYLHPIEFLT